VSSSLDGRTDPGVASRLRSRIKATIASTLFSPRSADCLETVQALLILAIWPLLPQTTPLDSQILVRAAVNMALDLKLNEASLKAEILSGLNSSSNDTEIKNLRSRARIVSEALYDCH
jgi:hypothetical protein